MSDYIGSPATDRNSSWAAANYTSINKEGAALVAGTITTVEIYALTGYDLANCVVATFYLTGTNTLKCRASQSVGAVHLYQSFPVSIAVEIGDYIGCFYTSGRNERDAVAGLLGVWYVAGDQTQVDDEQTYTLLATSTLSLYGTITAAGGVTEELTATLSGAGTLSGALSRKRGLAGTLAGAGSLGGALKRTRALSGVLSGAGSLSAALSLSGAVPAVVGGACKENNELAERDKARVIDGIPESYLVAFYPALHGRGATLIDRSQSANNGTISGATWKPSSRGLWVLDFDGDNDSVSLDSPTSLRITGAKTLEGWAYVHSVIATPRALVAWNGNGWATFRYMLAHDSVGGGSGRWIAHFSNGVNDWNQSIKNNSVVLNTWQHIVGTYDGVSEGALYINGTVADTTSYAITTPTSTNNIKIGTCDNVYYFDGRIGMVRIYNRVLSDTEILRHYTRERHLFGV